jgi:mannose-1-phosphate guanylyltransferase
MLEGYFHRHAHPQDVRVVTETRPLGTGGAIRNAVEAMGGVAETFLVRNADLVDTLPVASMLAAHRRNDGLATISLWEVEDPSPFGVAKLRGERIEFFVEKPKRHEAPTNLINAGTYVLEPEVLDYFPDVRDGELSIERTVFPEIVGTPRGMYGFGFHGHWVDCGRPDSYLEAHRKTLPQGPTLARGATFQGTAKGFACLGPNARVDAGAVLEDSVLLPEARVGPDARLVRSILGVGARVGAGARLEDVVLGDGAQVGPGEELRGAKIPEVVA